MTEVDDELSYRRVHRASRELLFECMTTPEHLAKFWGPSGTTTPIDGITVDLRPGGLFETLMVNDVDGSRYPMRAVYREVSPPERLVWEEAAAGVVTTITFSDLGDGTTEVVTHQAKVPAHYRTAEAQTGFATSLDRFGAYVAALGTQEPSDLQAVVAYEFTWLANVLDELADEAWDTPSLCAGWRVREVVAHMTMAVRYPPAEFYAELEACKGDFTLLSNRVAARDAALPTTTLVANLRDETMHAWIPPGGGWIGALSHVVIHGLDVTVPLGVARPAPDEGVHAVLDHLTVAGGHANFGFELGGLCLQATDADWTFGSGQPVRGTAADLVLLISGRTLAPGRILRPG